MTTRVTISTVSNAAEALQVDEVKRTRSLLQVGWLVAAIASVAIVLTPGDRRIANALLAALAACVAGSGWLYARLRDVARSTTWQMNALALACVIAGQLGILYVGVFSAAPTIVGLGLYFFCRSESRTSAIAIYAIAAGAHAIEGALVCAGVIADPGFYRTGHTPLYAQILGQGSMQVLYAVIFWLARVTRAASLQSIAQLQKATRLAAQREIQLAELRSDLDRALEIGGPGRYTGVVVGSWELGNVLGRGAMGEVYEALRVGGDGDAAVKLLRRELLADPHHVERFLREVRVASAIDSPHVVRVLEASTPVDALPFIAMERLRGQTLSKLLGKGRSLGDASLARLVSEVGSVLELARAAGIVHRDLKPQNLFLASGPERTAPDGSPALGEDVWKVLDFGVALLADTSGTLTRGHAVGTPAYMAPEQASGGDVDHRADLYALGAVIYRCATGRAPYAGRDTPALLYAVVHEMPLRPSAIAQVSPQLEQFLTVALAKSPDARFQSASELVAAFASPGPDLARRARTLAARHPWR